MKDVSVNDIVFELKDIEIFKIPDLKTRISTVQNYFFPRLEILLRDTLGLIQDIYEVNPYETMTIAYYPNNRRNAKENEDFYWVHIGLSGKRRIDRDLKYKRRDGKPFKLHPTYLTFKIDFDGSISVDLRPFRQYVSSEFMSDVNSLFKENFDAMSPIFELLHISHTRSVQFVSFRDTFTGSRDEVSWTRLYSPTYYFPVDSDRGLWQLVLSFVALYPLLASFNALGEGMPVNLPEMLAKFKEWFLNNDTDETADDVNDNGVSTDPEADEVNIPELDSYTFVRAGLWWAVLARDNWTCCSCGRSSREDGITLEVDHIIPRSKGGTDDFENLQTLCKKCNVGKSNKDSTDLRNVTSVL